MNGVIRIEYPESCKECRFCNTKSIPMRGQWNELVGIKDEYRCGVKGMQILNPGEIARFCPLEKEE